MLGLAPAMSLHLRGSPVHSHTRARGRACYGPCPSAAVPTVSLSRGTCTSPPPLSSRNRSSARVGVGAPTSCGLWQLHALDALFKPPEHPLDLHSSPNRAPLPPPPRSCSHRTALGEQPASWSSTAPPRQAGSASRLEHRQSPHVTCSGHSRLWQPRASTGPFAEVQPCVGWRAPPASVLHPLRRSMRPAGTSPPASAHG